MVCWPIWLWLLTQPPKDHRSRVFMWESTLAVEIPWGNLPLSISHPKVNCTWQSSFLGFNVLEGIYPSESLTLRNICPTVIYSGESLFLRSRDLVARYSQWYCLHARSENIFCLCSSTEYPERAAKERKRRQMPTFPSPHPRRGSCVLSVRGSFITVAGRARTGGITVRFLRVQGFRPHRADYKRHRNGSHAPIHFVL
jgi:hypothetical protein